MDKESRIEGVPDRFVDAFMTTRHWWGEDDSRLLPGEEGGSTVFVVGFADGCRYCGYTSGGVFSRLGELMGGPFDSGSSDFVVEHGRRMVYLVRCVASGMDMREKLGLCETCWSRRPLMNGPTATVRPWSTPAVGCLGR